MKEDLDTIIIEKAIIIWLTALLGLLETKETIEMERQCHIEGLKKEGLNIPESTTAVSIEVCSDMVHSASSCEQFLPFR